MENCNNCKWINVTEEEQDKNKNPHICLKHKTKLFHRSNNPRINHDYIYPCNKCNSMDFEQQ